MSETGREGLKPCPFCGCEVRLIQREFRDEMMGWRTWHHIEGEHDGIGGTCPGQVRARGSAKTAIAAWDRRDGEAAAEARGLERAAKACDKIAGNVKDHAQEYRRGAGHCAFEIRVLKGPADGTA